MTDDDDLLAAYDLSAWAPPPPPVGLADAVIERARQPAPVAAIDSSEPIQPRGMRRWWIGGAAAAAVAIVAVLVGVWGIQRSPEAGHGEVVASTARTLAIGPTTGALDPGTEIRWRRDKHKISVTQPRGTAMWNVAADDTLVIDAGAMGASVEASGASLRVEVEMINASDGRTLGISAATAVAVALVTIVVYEGAVRIHHDGHTVNVVPGTRYELRPPSPADPIAVGARPIDPRVRELEDRIKQLEAQRDTLQDTVDRNTSSDPCDEVSCLLNDYAGTCCAQLRHKTAAPPATAGIPDFLDQAAISKVLQPLRASILACPTGGFGGTLKTKIQVAPHGSVTSVAVANPITVPEVLTTCVRKIIEAANFPPTNGQTAFSYMFVFPAASAPPCDADALRQQGDDHLSTGLDAAALAAFEASMKCKADDSVAKKAVLAACRSKNASKAKLYYPKLSENLKAPLGQMCLRYGIALDDAAAVPATTCDAKALTDKGDDLLSAGMDVQALAAFEAAIKCRPGPALFKKAYVAACRSNNSGKARLYAGSLPENLKTAMGPVCIDQGIELTNAPKPPPTTPSCQPRNAVDPNDTRPLCTGGTLKVASKPSAKLLIDGVDTGKATPATFELQPGKHKVTFVIGGDKYTFAVNVEDGKTTSLTKELR